MRKPFLGFLALCAWFAGCIPFRAQVPSCPAGFHKHDTLRTVGTLSIHPYTCEKDDGTHMMWVDLMQGTFPPPPPGTGTLGGVFADTCTVHEFVDQVLTTGHLHCSLIPTPDTAVLGGVYAETCTGSNLMDGMQSSGHIHCTSPPSGGLTNVKLPSNTFNSSITGGIETVNYNTQPPGFYLGSAPVSPNLTQVVQGKACDVSGLSPAVCTETYTARVGDTLIAHLIGFAGVSGCANPQTVIDNLGNTYTCVYGTTGFQGSAVYEAPILTAGALTVTITNPQGSYSRSVLTLIEMSGVAATPFDAAADVNLNDVAHVPVATSVTTTNATDYLLQIQYVCANKTWTYSPFISGVGNSRFYYDQNFSSTCGNPMSMGFAGGQVNSTGTYTEYSTPSTSSGNTYGVLIALKSVSTPPAGMYPKAIVCSDLPLFFGDVDLTCPNFTVSGLAGLPLPNMTGTGFLYDNGTALSLSPGGLLPTGTNQGDILYWDVATTSWKVFFGNSSGTAWVAEDSSGAMAWSVPAGGVVPAGLTMGDLLVWDTGTSAWILFSGNTSGTKVLQEDASGARSWVSVPRIIFSDTQTAQTSGIGPITMASPTSPGLYRFSASILCDSASASTVTLQFAWLEHVGFAGRQDTTVDCTTLGGFPTPSEQSIVSTIRSTAETGAYIYYAAVVTLGSPTYSVDVRLELLP